MKLTVYNLMVLKIFCQEYHGGQQSRLYSVGCKAHVAMIRRDFFANYYYSHMSKKTAAGLRRTNLYKALVKNYVSG